jgi:hypothetical protein
MVEFAFEDEIVVVALQNKIERDREPKHSKISQAK